MEKESGSMSKLYRISADSLGVFKLRLSEYEEEEYLLDNDDKLDKLVKSGNHRFNIFTRDINRIDEHKLIMLRKFEEYYKGEKNRVDKSLSVIAENKVGLS